MTLNLGAPIGHYTVLEHVGAEGTTAQVYRGRDERHHRIVALKLLSGTTERSRREAHLMVTLDHPSIVTTFDVIEHHGRLCLVQEWIDGGSLAAELDAVGRLGVPEILRLGRDVASALSYAHERAILHRDITPSNVLRTVEGSYKLVDFGAFGQLEKETATTRSGEIAGTPLYMSPEQLTGAPQTSASDLFGLGLLLYRCLHGHLPAETETAGSYPQLAYSRVRTPISVPPSPLQGLLERCLALDPARRPQSAAEVLAALDQLSPPESSYGSTQGAAQPAAALPPPSRPGSAGTVPAYRRRRRVPRRRLLTAAAALIAVLGAAVVLTITLHSADTAPPSARPPSFAPSTTAPSTTSTPAPATPAPPRGTGNAGDPEPASPGYVLEPLNIVSVLARLCAGLTVAAVGLVLAQQIRRRWASRAPEAERRAATILFGVDQRNELTQSLVIEVDQVVRNLNSLDAKFLGMTVVAMIREYEDAKESSERQAALLNVVALMEKLQAHFSPWHVRHKDAIATGIAVVGALAGVASVISGFLG